MFQLLFIQEMKNGKYQKIFKEKQISDYVFENYKIDLEYNLIEINKLSKSFLLQKQSLFGYGMIIEKSKNKQERKRKSRADCKTCEK